MTPAKAPGAADVVRGAAIDVTLTADELAVLDPLAGQVAGARY